ncbi:uncharacterized protein LOC108665146 [Hyalella azteca]|uniref:Uncharacterized protein LOC108665146 n=1 Tax=Hyalella azteca TaxID=294128 RepID=A0A8B7N1D3_HYAAZ|nr:uncharacterized protein LOC108665146 [Hyalella azteca]
MMKSVGLVLLLIAAFAYSGVEGANSCATVLQNTIWQNADLKAALSACKSDPDGRAALTALGGYAACRGYNFGAVKVGKCDAVAAPYMKCVAGKLGYLKADGSINNAKISDQYKTYATRGSLCTDAMYNSAAGKCGTVTNYAFLVKAECIIKALNQYSG